MLPLVSRATQEMLLLVPGSLREAAYALGASRWRTVLGIVLPTSLGGILTGTTLAIARVAGETAPLLFTSSLVSNAVTWDPRQPLQSVTLSIFQLSESAGPCRSRPSLGRGARTDLGRSPAEPHLARAPRPQPAEAGTMTPVSEREPVINVAPTA